jgi:7-alpha-hydroxysteroid dehydrogenase
MSSTGNIVHTDNYAGHGSSKASLEIMVKYAALELAHMNVRVNALSGGPIETDALRKFPNFEELKAEVIKRTPLGRMGLPTDLAGVAKFLCSDDAKWITGQTIIADGGSSFT